MIKTAMMTIQCDVDDYENKHCLHTEGKDEDPPLNPQVRPKNLCYWGKGDMCLLFDQILETNHMRYFIRCQQCLETFGE